MRSGAVISSSSGVRAFDASAAHAQGSRDAHHRAARERRVADERRGEVCAHETPQKRRIVVPELPQSRSRSGARSPKRPTPVTTTSLSLPSKWTPIARARRAWTRCPHRRRTHGCGSCRCRARRRGARGARCSCRTARARSRRAASSAGGRRGRSSHQCRIQALETASSTLDREAGRREREQRRQDEQHGEPHRNASSYFLRRRFARAVGRERGV